jgi:hypothetical protein
MIGAEERQFTVTAFDNDVTVTFCFAWVRCDHAGCGATHAVQAGVGEENVWQAAKELGWTWDGDKRDGCPLHPAMERDDE